jgi:hypothetical protein
MSVCRDLWPLVIKAASGASAYAALPSVQFDGGNVPGCLGEPVAGTFISRPGTANLVHCRFAPEQSAVGQVRSGKAKVHFDGKRARASRFGARDGAK